MYSTTQKTVIKKIDQQKTVTTINKKHQQFNCIFKYYA